MKKIIYIIAILLLPVVSFSQHKDIFNTADQTPPAGRMIDIFPNPGNGMFTVLFSKNNDIFANMVVYGNTGKQVYVKDHLNGNPVLVDLSHLQAGIYFLVFTSGDKNVRMTEKIAIVK